VRTGKIANPVHDFAVFLHLSNLCFKLFSQNFVLETKLLLTALLSLMREKCIANISHHDVLNCYQSDFVEN